jgi:hypothetical protein
MKYLYQNERGDADGKVIGIVATLGAILIAIYILTMVTGGISQSTEQNSLINETSNWGPVFNNMDQMGGAGFQLASLLPIILVGIGVMGLIMVKLKMD